ncbi:MAG: hypothetical protein JWP87_922 [Labilithrix sp.]|nr:hypothetical protein [Labilithrix sp.]
MNRRRAAALAAFAIVLACPGHANAQRTRRRFEPTDLRLQPAGVAELDLQAGVVTGEDGQRAFVPDFEASLGITPHVELEVDGAFGLDRLVTPELLDNTLVALRLAVIDEPDAPESSSKWSGGVQAGPRLPTLPSTHGMGFEALAIAGRSTERIHVFVQAGTLVDPAEPVRGRRSLVRPFGIEAGLDLDLDLDDRDVWSVTGELGGIHYLSPQRDQLHAAFGPSAQVSSSLELSLVGLVGILPGGDRLGLLLGANSRFRMF